MKVTASGGLGGMTDNVGRAANEDQLAEASVVKSEPQSHETAGWDPYEVWRTRVKSVRDIRSKTDSEDVPI